MSIVVIILGAPGALISTGAVMGWIDFVMARYQWQVKAVRTRDNRNGERTRKYEIRQLQSTPS